MSLKARLEALEARAAASKPSPASAALRANYERLLRGEPIAIDPALGDDAAMVEGLLAAFDAVPDLLRAQMARHLGLEADGDAAALDADPEA